MNKTIIISIITAVIILITGWFLYYSNRLPQMPKNQNVENQPVEKSLFDTNDNLDQAIEDLNQID